MGEAGDVLVKDVGVVLRVDLDADVKDAADDAAERRETQADAGVDERHVGIGNRHFVVELAPEPLEPVVEDVEHGDVLPQVGCHGCDDPVLDISSEGSLVELQNGSTLEILKQTE